MVPRPSTQLAPLQDSAYARTRLDKDDDRTSLHGVATKLLCYTPSCVDCMPPARIRILRQARHGVRCSRHSLHRHAHTQIKRSLLISRQGLQEFMTGISICLGYELTSKDTCCDDCSTLPIW